MRNYRAAGSPHAAARTIRRGQYAVVAGVLVIFWAAVAVCVAAVFVIAAAHDRDADGASASAQISTPSPEPTPTPAPPRPRDVPLTAQPIEGTFDSGAPVQHLFF